MSYEHAPATELVATDCAFCGRPLVDANSLAAGVGPECRRKYALPDMLSNEERAAANAAIYGIAKYQTGNRVAEALAVLYGLGLDYLCDRVVKRLQSAYVATIATDGPDRFSVRCGYEVAMQANLGLVAGRRWEKDRKLSTFPVSARREVWASLRNAAPGALCFGPKGEFRL